MRALEPGTIVGSFRIARTLAEGPGAGTVYEATGGGLDRPVALKVFAARLSESPQFRERFRRDAPRLAAVEHPSITRIYEVGSSVSGLYMAMRLVDGPTLAELVARGPLDLDAAVELLGPVAEALDLAHDSGVLHRDLKPQKILVGASGRAFLTGFAPARPPTRSRWQPSGRASEALGSLAPEQARGEPPDRRSEVYSLAAVLYEAIAGFPASRAESDGATRPAPPNDPRARLPDELGAIVARALADDPDERPATGARLMRELRRATRSGTPAGAGSGRFRRAPAAGARPAPVAVGAARPSPTPAKGTGAEPSPVTAAAPAPGRAAGERSSATPAVAASAAPAAASAVAASAAAAGSASAPAEAPRARAGAGPPSARRRRAGRHAGRRHGALPAALAIVALGGSAAVAGWYLPDLLDDGGAARTSSRASAPLPRAISSEAYTTALSRTLERLNERRAEREAALQRARTAPAQARAASSLGAAHAQAAAALSYEAPAPPQRRAHATIVAALRELAAGYRGMATAARSGDSRGFAEEARRVRRGEARVRGAVERL